MTSDLQSALAPAREPAPKGPVLAFDTSGPWIMAGLSGRPMWREDMAKGQAERLMPMLSELLAAEGLGFRDLSALAVGTGPGNFTGIRIAVAAARGLALALKIPAVGVSQFEIQAEGAGEGPLLIALPAPQGRAYLQRFGGGAPLAAPHLLTPGEGEPDLAQLSADVTGHAAAEIAAGLGLGLRDLPHWSALEDFDLPQVMIRIATRRLGSGAALPRPAPLYVRPADAAPPSDPPPVILDA
ncbi:tRNA (adenosine(37)-N6)-threonylcarbamoyltransferase complex dimerization subunit type 1 TsaB [Falsigemmobacter faecalis]|uniref:tRNA (Adenosine(37)-N6)-threonylcarbamoyltransferase complex dimerization subunit type 1 TsaB n=1 Tax=Falsigemmobacter faecalis TaxID=2488730 RepID=A0A3P3DSL7_9RHOB|nr:tRNA (adenosine(37)-N6)-threonylcarbamoyltransferase complex dimerization subunit type 1 TsaB [Falsigemmobacter faecalis]RRH77283.1 tRNA (adenosine(37)-N6)-threonylcarbamoyltransferase complex dimerization subunit type 1 TsaB [Falsigemmobacter faecalis]